LEKLKNLENEALHLDLGSHDSLMRFTAAKELQIRGEEKTYHLAKNLCNSSNKMMREVGAFILGQLGTPALPFLTQSIPILSTLLINDLSAEVRACAASSLGHLASSNSFDVLASCIRDDNSKVRENIAFALGCLRDERGIPSLLTLAEDVDPNVRNWAVFSIRNVGSGSPVVRDKFAQMLNDPSQEVRREIIISLAEWQDLRVFASLQEELNCENVFFDLIEAAGNLGDPRFLPRLKELQKEWADEPPQELINAVSKIEKLIKGARVALF